MSLSFSESYINNGVDITYTRNAIDRFTGGTVDGALYKESTRFEGRDISLIIKIDSTEHRKLAAPYLAAAIMDLNAGYLSVGGLTAIGRGLFEIKQINQTSFNADYEQIKTMIEEGR